MAEQAAALMVVVVVRVSVVVVVQGHKGSVHPMNQHYSASGLNGTS